MTEAELRQRALAAAGQASAALAELIRFAAEGPSHPGPFGHEEVIELLADAVKMAIEIDPGPAEAERGQLHAALAKYLEGWA